MADVGNGGGGVSERPRVDIGEVVRGVEDARMAHVNAQTALIVAEQRLEASTEALKGLVGGAIDGVFAESGLEVGEHTLGDVTLDVRAGTLAFVLQVPQKYDAAEDMVSPNMNQVNAALSGLGDSTFVQKVVDGKNVVEFKVTRVQLSTLRGVLNGDSVSRPVVETPVYPAAGNSPEKTGWFDGGASGEDGVGVIGWSPVTDRQPAPVGGDPEEIRMANMRRTEAALGDEGGN